MAEVKPLKLSDVGGGVGELREFAVGDSIPPANLPANLAALSGLTGAADRLPYFTGAGALSLATLTSLARTLLDDTTQSEMQSTLGLVKQTSATGTTAGALLTVGAFGLGTSFTATDSDANAGSYIIPGAHFLSTLGGTNFPPVGSSRCLVHVVGSVGGGLSQVFTVRDTGDTYVRVYDSVSWGPWRKLYTQGTILGTVSQSAGVPTGAIIERGGNANGEYVRFADGTQICTTSSTQVAQSINNAFMGGFRSSGFTWTFPATFSSSAIVTGSMQGGTDGFSVQNLTQSPTISAIYVFTAVTSQAAADRSVRLVAIGRWF